MSAERETEQIIWKYFESCTAGEERRRAAAVLDAGAFTISSRTARSFPECAKRRRGASQSSTEIMIPAGGENQLNQFAQRLPVALTGMNWPLPRYCSSTALPLLPTRELVVKVLGSGLALPE